MIQCLGKICAPRANTAPPKGTICASEQLPGPLLLPVDALARMVSLQSRLRDRNSDTNAHAINLQKTDHKIALDRLLEHLENARKAEDGPGLFDFVTDVISHVASDLAHLEFRDLAARPIADIKNAFSSSKFWNETLEVAGYVAAVCGAGAAIAGAKGKLALILSVSAAVVSAATIADQKLSLLEKMGMDEKETRILRIGALATSTALSIGSAFATSSKAQSAAAGTATARASLSSAATGETLRSVAQEAAWMARPALEASEKLHAASAVARATEVFGQIVIASNSETRDQELAASEREKSVMRKTKREQQRLLSGIRDWASQTERLLKSLRETILRRDELALGLAHRMA